VRLTKPIVGVLAWFYLRVNWVRPVFLPTGRVKLIACDRYGRPRAAKGGET
jgi:hypothetical protein